MDYSADGNNSMNIENEFPSVPVARDRLVRVSIAVYLPRVMLSLGLDPDPLIRRAGLALSMFDDPDNRIKYEKLAQLCEDAANASGCDHFALLLGSHGNLETLGPVGANAAQRDTIGGALGRIIENFREHDTGAVVDIEFNSNAVSLRYLVIDPKVSSGAQIALGAVTVGYQILQQLSNGCLITKLVKLPMREPRKPTAFSDFFKCPVQFNSPVAGLSFDGAWLAASLPEFEQTGRGSANAPHKSLPADEGLNHSAEIIAAALLRRIFAGMSLSAESVSNDFDFNRRTLHRRLSQAGTSFKELRDNLLLGLARRFLNDTDITITDIALLLGYSELATFTRAFRSWQGNSPSEYRGFRALP